MSGPITTATKLAASTLGSLLDQNPPTEPELTNDMKVDLNLLNDAFDETQTLLHEMQEAFGNLASAVTKWSKLIEKSEEKQREVYDQRYTALEASLGIVKKQTDAQQRIKQLTTLLNRIKSNIRIQQQKFSDAEEAQKAKRADQARFKIPNWEISKFSGKSTEWAEFWQVFEVTVHQTELAPELKHSYLKRAVEGEAKAIIAGLELRDYQIAVDLLTQKYGQKEAYTRELHSCSL